jgi:hypothetical protein
MVYGGHQRVRRLDVAVDHAGGVRCVECRADLGDEATRVSARADLRV